MLPQTILEIIRLILEITLEAMKNMPPEEKAAFWARHEANMAFWQKVFNRLNPVDPS